jgi:type II secretory pathway pseudopilin PulG
MIVVGIIAIISALVLLPNVLRSRLNANDAFAQATLKTISNALESYLSGNSAYPTDINVLRTVTPPYLNADYFNAVPYNGFTFVVTTLTDYSYVITATPASTTQGTQSFTISTGGLLK